MDATEKRTVVLEYATKTLVHANAIRTPPHRATLACVVRAFHKVVSRVLLLLLTLHAPKIQIVVRVHVTPAMAHVNVSLITQQKRAMFALVKLVIP